MTPTEELRKRLDELGIEWWQRKGHTCWNVKKDEGIELWRAWVAPNGTITLKTDAIYGFTPEQAIAATVGETCKNVCASISEFTCSECGFNCDLTSWISLFDGDDGRHRHHHHGTPNYCPNCGRKVAE